MPVFSLASRLGAAALGMALGGALMAAPARAGTLYDDLGGRPGLQRIADGMLDRALQDPRIRDKFADADIERLHGLVMLQFCVLTGGPCRSKGRNGNRRWGAPLHRDIVAPPGAKEATP